MNDPVIIIFLTGGLFLGWSLGANDAANVFGTAVGSRMVRFTTAALICGVFVILGAVISGTGTSLTLGKLGAVNAIGGSFMAAVAAGLTVYWMTKFGIPVSTSQAIIGSIIGWNLFSDSYTDLSSLLKILATWVVCPLLAALIAAILFTLAKYLLKKIRIGLIRLDGYTRLALILAGAFGAYSLGANNIANVMGVFVPVSPFMDIQVSSMFRISSIQQLFLLGGLAIAVGVFTYSKRVMMTVGSELITLTPLAAWVAVTAHSIVLFLFASEGLERFLANLSLPTIPLVPVSSSQAVVGAVIGIGIVQGGRELQWQRIYSIVKGWVITPIISLLICIVGLYFLQNVFQQKVKQESKYQLSSGVLEQFSKAEINIDELDKLTDSEFFSSAGVVRAVKAIVPLSSQQGLKVVEYSLQNKLFINADKLSSLDRYFLSKQQLEALKKLEGEKYVYSWQLGIALAQKSKAWELHGDGLKNKLKDREIKRKLAYLYLFFKE